MESTTHPQQKWLHYILDGEQPKGCPPPLKISKEN